MDGIIWTDIVRSARVLQKIKGERNVLQKTKKRKVTLLVKSCMGTAF